MPWTPPKPEQLKGVARGARAQWMLRLGQFPVLLGAAAAVPRWLVALLRARALARGGADACALMNNLEADFAAITGLEPIEWPAGFGAVRSRKTMKGLDPRKLELPRLDPSQHLAVTGGLGCASPAARAAVGVLLVAGFGGAASGCSLSDDARARALAGALPSVTRGIWQRGLGLEPPAVLAPPETLAATRLIDAAFGGADPRPVDPGSCAPLSASDATDLVLSALALRAALRASEPAIAQPNPRARVA